MIEVLERRVSDECGCLEEDLICQDLFMTIHHEPDGSGHITVDFGEMGEEEFFTDVVEDMAALEKEAEKLALRIITDQPKGDE